MKAYLLICLDNGHYAISTEQLGSKIPSRECNAGWRYVRQYPLDDPPASDALLEELRTSGYYLLLRSD